MTTLAAWVGVDQRAPASIYLVSDSRFTFLGHDENPKISTDQGTKIYASKQEPHLFGFVGPVTFPTRAIREAVRKIDSGILFSATDNCAARQEIFADYLNKYLGSQLACGAGRQGITAFTIVHIAREGVGMECRFRMWILGWSPDSSWNIRERKMENKSQILYADGSGAGPFRQFDSSWKDSELGRTSRGVFSAFTQALSEGIDKRTGGAPQLGGLFREGRAMIFGLIYKNSRFIGGKEHTDLAVLPVGLEWFNELFERVDPLTMKRLPEAQRHAKPNWLRPYKHYEKTCDT